MYKKCFNQTVYNAVDEDHSLSKEKVKNCVIRNSSEHVNEEVIKENDLKLVKSILKEANIDGNIVNKVERQLTRVPNERLQKAVEDICAVKGLP